MRDGFEAKPGYALEAHPHYDSTAGARVALGRIATSAALAKDASTRVALGNAAVSAANASRQETRARGAEPLGQAAKTAERNRRVI